MATAADSAPATVVGRLDELLGRQVSMRAMALIRILVGPVVLLHLRPLIDDARAGRIYRDVFYEPYASWYPELPRDLYVAMLWIGAIAAVLMTLGAVTRVATATVAVIVTYNVFLSTTNFHNNRAYLMIVLAALALVPCGRELSVDAWVRRRTGRSPLPTTSAAWPLWLLRVEAATVYGASGLSKLLDPDWFGGAVTWHRLVLQRDRMEASVLPSWAIDVLTDRDFQSVAAKLVIATELFIALGLWWRGTRYAAVWIAICFHVAIQLSADVEVFSYLAIAALAMWAVPATRDRVLVIDPTRRWQLAFGHVVRSLDWLARFRVDLQRGGPVRVIDRDGGELVGGRAIVLTFSRLPLTAWFALPLRLVAKRSA
ncbi:MAG: HTTM domain-containing protein [Ilumatobacteraceae bacterium]